MKFDELQKKQHIAILGRWREGKSSYIFLTKKLWIAKEKITILDQNENIKTPPWVNTHLWKNYWQWFEVYDIIFKSPGITFTLMQDKWWIKTTWIPFISQTQLFFDNYQGKIIWITGTKWKTTISTILYKSLQEYWKDVVLAGNVGKPVLDTLDFKTPPEIIVYELSSFMLEELHDFKLDIWLFNTLYSTHTTEHGGYEKYVLAKTKILHHSDHLLIGYQAQEQLGRHIQWISYDVYGKTGKYTWEEWNFMKDGKLLFTDQWMLIPGEHNRHNICGIVGIFDTLMKKWIIKKNDWTGLQYVLQHFAGVEHRIEYVGEYENIRWYNDAIATTPQATVAAIQTFKDEIDTLFYGGIDGEYDHSEVASLIVKYNVRNLILFPDTWKKLEQLLYSSDFTWISSDFIKKVNIFHTSSMQEAVYLAKKHTQKWKIALLSCGSPSFSCWSWFEEKGRLFKKYVKEHDE